MKLQLSEFYENALVRRMSQVSIKSGAWESNCVTPKPLNQHQDQANKDDALVVARYEKLPIKAHVETTGIL